MCGEERSKSVSEFLTGSGAKEKKVEYSNLTF